MNRRSFFILSSMYRALSKLRKRGARLGSSSRLDSFVFKLLRVDFALLACASTTAHGTVKFSEKIETFSHFSDVYVAQI